MSYVSYTDDQTLTELFTNIMFKACHIHFIVLCTCGVFLVLDVPINGAVIS